MPVCLDLSDNKKGLRMQRAIGIFLLALLPAAGWAAGCISGDELQTQGPYACSSGGRYVGESDGREHSRGTVMYHFGEKDGSLPSAAIAKIRAADSAGIFHVYPGAGHAFTNDERPSFDAPAA